MTFRLMDVEDAIMAGVSVDTSCLKQTGHIMAGVKPNLTSETPGKTRVALALTRDVHIYI